MEKQTKKFLRDLVKQENHGWVQNFGENHSESLNKFVEAAPIPIIIIDEDTKILKANRKFEKLSGFSKKEIEGVKFWTEFVSGADLNQMLKYHYERRLYPNNVIKEYEFQFIDKNNKTHDILLSVDIIQGTKNSLALLCDISNQKITTKAILKYKERAQKYLDIAEVIILTLDTNGDITQINQKGNKVLGYQNDELIGKNWLDTCVPTRERKERRQIYRKFINNDPHMILDQETSVLTNEGKERIISWHIKHLWDEKKRITGVICSGEDITDRKRQEKFLDMCNKASRVIKAAQTEEEIYNSITNELKHLDISSVIFLIDATKRNLCQKYLNTCPVSILAEEKLVGINLDGFSFPIDAADFFRKVVVERETLYIESPEQIIHQLLPNLSKNQFSQIKKFIGDLKIISFPLILRDQVIGVFTL